MESPNDEVSIHPGAKYLAIPLGSCCHGTY